MGNPPIPFSFTPRKQAKFLTLLAKTGSIRGAAGRLGISRDTIWHHSKNDPAFRQAIERAIDEAEQSLLDRIVDSANTGRVIERRGETITEPGDWKAATWLLEHSPFFRDRYAGIMRQKVEVSGSDDLPPVRIEGSETQQIEIGPDTMERLTQVVLVLARAGKLRLPDPGEIIDGQAERGPEEA